jgi:hypothetical protein
LSARNAGGITARFKAAEPRTSADVDTAGLFMFMISRARNSVFLTLVAVVALALSFAQPMAFACQLQMNAHHNCAHSVPSHGAESHQNKTCPQCPQLRGAAQAHAVVHREDKHSNPSAASTQHCHDVVQSHQPSQRDERTPANAHLLTAPDTLPAAVQLSASQTQLTVPAAPMTLRRPQATTVPLWTASHRPPPRRDLSVLLSRAPPT